MHNVMCIKSDKPSSIYTILGFAGERGVRIILNGVNACNVDILYYILQLFCTIQRFVSGHVAYEIHLGFLSWYPFRDCMTLFNRVNVRNGPKTLNIIKKILN